VEEKGKFPSPGFCDHFRVSTPGLFFRRGRFVVAALEPLVKHCSPATPCIQPFRISTCQCHPLAGRACGGGGLGQFLVATPPGVARNRFLKGCYTNSWHKLLKGLSQQKAAH